MRRKLENKNVRSLVKTGRGKSYSITLPIEAIRKFRWQKKQKLQLEIDEKSKKITIRDWEK